VSNINKAIKRDRKINKRRYGMRRDGDSVKVIQKQQQKRRDKAIAKGRKTKEEFIERITKESYSGKKEETE